MPGTKKTSKYRKKRAGKGFSGVQRHSKIAKKCTDDDTSTPSRSCLEVGSESCPTSSTETDQPVLSASRSKMKPKDLPVTSLQSSDDEVEGSASQFQGYRLVDLNMLSSAMSEAHLCQEGMYFVTDDLDLLLYVQFI